MSGAFDYCEALVREADKDRFLATLFAPASARPFLFALYAFNVEIGRIRSLVSGPMPGEIRLQWWRDALGGLGASEAQANPVAAALIETTSAVGLPIEPLIDLIEAHSFDLYDDPMTSLAELEAYADRTSTGLTRLAAGVLGATGESVTRPAQAAGRAHAIARLLLSFPLHASRGQLYVPLEILQRHGVVIADVFSGKESDALTGALAEMRSLGRRWFREFADASESVSAAALPAYLPAYVVPLYLDRLDCARLFETIEVAQWRRQWALWRASRTASTPPR